MSSDSSKSFLLRNGKLPWTWFQAFAVGILLIVGIDALLGVSIGLLTYFIDLEVDLDSFGFNFIFYASSRLLALFVLAKYLKGRQVSLTRFGLRSFKPIRSLGYLIVAATAFFVSTGIIFALLDVILPNLNLEQAQDLVFAQAHTLIEITLSFVALIIIAPVAEEMIFRGLMLPIFAKRFGVVAGVLITSLLFGMVHGQFNVGLLTFILGIFLSWLYIKTESLWPVIILHSLKNLLAFVVIF